jgi:hypothetical protein
MTYKMGQNNVTRLEIQFRNVDGRKVRVANFITDDKLNRRRLDAPYGYQKRIDFGSGIPDDCIVYVMMSMANYVDRYATVFNPDSDPLVSYRCRKI